MNNNQPIEFPIISLTSKIVEQVMQAACTSFGGFVLTDHGVDLQNIIKLGHQFFELPIAFKEKYNLQHYGAKWRGYMPIGVERSVNGTPRDYKEGLCMGDEHSPLDARIGAPTFGSNVFSDLELPEMRPEYIRHHEQMKSLGNKTMGILSKSLELSQDHLESHVTKNDPVILPRMFRYPPKVDEDDSLSEDEHWGIGRHSDYGLWTMIVSDGPGLEFEQASTGVWCPALYIPDSIIMNVGDVLDRLTSGRFVSSYHRARKNSHTSYRLSLPLFYDPAWDSVMQVLPISPEEEMQLDTPERAAR